MKDAKKLSAAGLRTKAQHLLEVIRKDPYASLPHFEKLKGDLTGAYSRRINIKHRLVYYISQEEQTVRVLSMWTHYDITGFNLI